MSSTSAAAYFQQNLQWARAYALRSDQGVEVDVTSQIVQGQRTCAWSMALYQPPPQQPLAISSAPAMTANEFAKRFPNVSCAVSALPAMPITMQPDGTIIVAAAGAGAPSPANGYVAFAANTNAVRYASWLVKYYGAGELRSCVPAAIGATTCVLQ